MHHLDDALTREVGHLGAVAIGSGNSRAPGQAHPEGLGNRVHRAGRAHCVAVSRRRGRRGYELDEFRVVDLARREQLARRPHDGSRTGALALIVAVEHRAAGQDDGREVDRRRPHDLGRRGLVTAGRQHDGVDWVAVQDLDQPEILEIAVERGGRALAGLLDRVERKLERHPAGIADALAHTLGELDVVPVAGRNVGAALRDADNRTARLQFIQRQPVVHGALEVERSHIGVGRIVEPGLRAQPSRRCAGLFMGTGLPVGAAVLVRAGSLGGHVTVLGSCCRPRRPFWELRRSQLRQIDTTPEPVIVNRRSAAPICRPGIDCDLPTVPLAAVSGIQEARDDRRP